MLSEGSETITKTVKKVIPKLSYSIVEGNFKHLQGQILTLIEATITNEQQLKATKNLIKGYVNDKLTWLFDQYGEAEREIPDYNPVDLPGYNN